MEHIGALVGHQRKRTDIKKPLNAKASEANFILSCRNLNTRKERADISYNTIDIIIVDTVENLLSLTLMRYDVC